MSPRRRMRTLLDRGAEHIGLLRRLEDRMRRVHTILMYHRVLPDTVAASYPLSSLVVGESVFKAQVQWLAERCNVVPVHHSLGGSTDDPRPTVSITFDDGYRDNAERAAELLESVGLRGTFFVTTGPVAERDLLWFDVVVEAHRRRGPGDFLTPTLGERLSSLKALPDEERRDRVEEARSELGGEVGELLGRYGLMSPQQVLNLSCRGHEIGSHTVSHPILTRTDSDTLVRELRDSREQLERWIDRPVEGFAYPNGSYDERVVAAVRAAGYRYSVTVEPGSNERNVDRFRLARRDITPGRTATEAGEPDLRGFRAELCGFREWFR